MLSQKYLKLLEACQRTAKIHSTAIKFIQDNDGPADVVAYHGDQLIEIRKHIKILKDAIFWSTSVEKHFEDQSNGTTVEADADV